MSEVNPVGRPKQDFARVSIYLKRADSDYLKKAAEILNVTQASLIRDMLEQAIGVMYDTFGPLDGTSIDPEQVVLKMMRKSISGLNDTFEDLDYKLAQIKKGKNKRAFLRGSLWDTARRAPE